MEQPTVKTIKVYAVVEQVLESRCEPQELNDYLRKNRFTGTANFSYDAAFNQGGIRTIVTKEHIPLAMSELDKILTERNGGLKH
jgi:hypothetical protein